jgi:hypothetical protein
MLSPTLLSQTVLIGAPTSDYDISFSRTEYEVPLTGRIILVSEGAKPSPIMDADRLGGTIIDPCLTQISLLHIYFVLTPMPQTRHGD